MNPCLWVYDPQGTLRYQWQVQKLIGKRREGLPQSYSTVRWYEQASFPVLRQKDTTIEILLWTGEWLTVNYVTGKHEVTPARVHSKEELIELAKRIAIAIGNFEKPWWMIEEEFFHPTISSKYLKQDPHEPLVRVEGELDRFRIWTFRVRISPQQLPHIDKDTSETTLVEMNEAGLVRRYERLSHP